MTNEEKILSTLEKHSEMLEKQGKILEKHSEMLEKQGKILENHEKILESLQVDVSGIKVRLDVEFERKFQLLAEGHETILETLAPTDRVEALENDVALMKSVIKAMSQEIAELKKAQ